MTEDISRDEVIERVKRGQMTPDQAEAWAANKGTQPFAEPRTIQHFDPFQEVYWSLPMVAAWIIWRRPQAVLEVVPRKGLRCKIWEKESATSFVLVTPDDWSLGCVYLKAIENDDSEENPRVIEAVEAREQLHMRLQGGDLRASGLNSESQRTEIPPVEWQDISRDNWGKDANSVFGVGTGLPRYSAVTVRKADAVANWGALAGWEWLSPNPLASRPPGRPSYMQFVMAKFQGRCAANELMPRVNAEAEFLYKWQIDQKLFPRASPKTIENNIRSLYRQAIEKAPK
jgi:hypothetical protein